MLEIEINSLSDFLRYLESNIDGTHIYRGESSHYPEVMASALRKNNGFYYNYKELFKEYYREVAADLSELERTNFLAYSQHHGLPTPLIDMTTNPLVALYFSCSSGPRYSQGYIHAIAKNTCIPFDAIDSRELDSRSSLFCLTKPKTQVNFIKYLNEIKYDKLVDHLLIDIIQRLLSLNEPQKRMLVDDNSQLEVLLTAIIEFSNEENASELDTIEQVKDMLLDLEDNEEVKLSLDSQVDILQNNHPEDDGLLRNYIINRTFNGDTYFTLAFWWVTLVASYLNVYWSNVVYKLRNENPYNEVLLIEVPLLPNIKYRTGVNFDRIKSQYGEFLYQLNDLLIPDMDIFPIQQSIIVDKTIVINNKDEILKGLDAIGINEQSLFLDHDSTAKYLAWRQISKQENRFE